MRYREIIAVALLMLCAGKLNAQGELGAWDFLQEVSLSQSMQNDPDLTAVFADQYLLVTQPGLAAADEGCGLVQVYSRSVGGEFDVIQILSQSDFGAVCNQIDGFGYSLDFADGVLAIGAPGQINLSQSGSGLSPGGVFIYAAQASSGFQPVMALPGTGVSGNMAWGTRVKTDGQVLLVQGNELGDEQTSQGRANPRSVNVFSNEGFGWQPLQVFTDSAPTLFGQDFAISNNQLFINQHNFIREETCGAQNRVITAGYRTGIIQYQRFLSQGSFEFNTSVEFGNSLANQFVVAGLDQLSIQDTGSDVEVFAYDGVFFCGGFQRGHSEQLVQYQINENDEFVTAGRLIINAAPSSFDAEGTDTEFPTKQSLKPSQGFVLGIDFNSQGRAVINSHRLFDLIIFNGDRLLSSEAVQTEFLFESPEREFIRSATLEVNAQEDVFVLTGNNTGQNRVILHQKIPALDPAITQAWWFGRQFDGQGVTLEVLSNNRLLMHWFTYDLSGNQMWVRGVGQLVDGEVNMQLVRGMGPSFTFGAFDPDDRVIEPWGQATIRFDSCTRGVLSYQSNEFGNGQLPLVPLANNGFECNRGSLLATLDDPLNIGTPSIAGSFFDPERAGEGIILMPLPNGRRQNVTNGRPEPVNRILGLWLTYTPMGEQAWYYLGIFEGCDGRSITPSSTCVLETDGRPPLSSSGPIFGPGYNPRDRVRIPWGTAGRFESGRFERTDSSSIRSPLALRVDNPHGTGILIMRQATVPEGYKALRD